jgi:hypothetical protein
MRIIHIGMGLFAVCTAAVFFSFAVFAQTGATPPPPRHGVVQSPPCADDIQRLCKAVSSGQGRKIACVHAHMPQLQPRCHTFIAALYAHYTEMAAQNHETVEQLLTNAYAREGTGVQVNSANPNSAHPQVPKSH